MQMRMLYNHENITHNGGLVDHLPPNFQQNVNHRLTIFEEDSLIDESHRLDENRTHPRRRGGRECRGCGCRVDGGLEKTGESLSGGSADLLDAVGEERPETGAVRRREGRSENVGSVLFR